MDSNKKKAISSSSNSIIEIKETSKEIMLSSSINGIPNLIRTRRFGIKLLWTMCLLASVSICFYMVVQSILDYLSYEVATKIRKINQFPSPFPAITICNSNSFLTNYSLNLVDELNLKFSDENILENDTIFYVSSNPYYRNNIYNNLEFVRYLAQSYAISDRTIDDEKKRLGLSIDDILISCHFAGTDCSYEDFEWEYNFDYGNCFTFRSDLTLNRSITRTGKYDGLTLELFFSEPVSTQMDSGVYIYISNDSISVSNNEVKFFNILISYNLEEFII